jgi:hypothetical protein
MHATLDSNVKLSNAKRISGGGGDLFAYGRNEHITEKCKVVQIMPKVV